MRKIQRGFESEVSWPCRSPQGGSSQSWIRGRFSHPKEMGPSDHHSLKPKSYGVAVLMFWVRSLWLCFKRGCLVVPHIITMASNHVFLCLDIRVPPIPGSVGLEVCVMCLSIRASLGNPFVSCCYR